MFDNSSNITQYEVCSEVSLFKRENVKFEDVVPFNVSADRPQDSVKGNYLSQLDTGSF